MNSCYRMSVRRLNLLHKETCMQYHAQALLCNGHEMSDRKPWSRALNKSYRKRGLICFLVNLILIRYKV